MTLYDVHEELFTAYVNPLKNECLTSYVFSSCVIGKDGKAAKLKTLITDLKDGESRIYGCDISSSKPGQSVDIKTWKVDVTSKFPL